MESPGRLGGVVLFLDDRMIDRHKRVTRRWLPADVEPRPCLVSEHPWETRTLEFANVIAKPDGYEAFYTGVERPAGRRTLLVAQSIDGFRWTKPHLPMLHGTRPAATNIVGTWGGMFNSPSIVHDDTWERPYRMLAFRSLDPAGGWAPDWGLHAFDSADGRTWDELGQVMRSGDRNTLAWDADTGVYTSYCRQVDPVMHADTSGRAVYRSTSTDFRVWTEPQLILAPDLADAADVEFYGMAAFRRHDWLIGLIEIWHRATDVMEVQLAFSRDGITWARPADRSAFIGPVHDWNRRWNTTASTGPLAIGDRLVFYVNGRSVGHDFDAARQDGAIGIASLPIDRFCALESDVGGWVETPPFIWTGGDLVVNADTRRSFASHPRETNGILRVEVRDATGEERAGWSGAEGAVFRGNTHAQGMIDDGVVRWEGDVSLDRLTGEAMRLRFVLDHARLYAFGPSA